MERKRPLRHRRLLLGLSALFLLAAGAVVWSGCVMTKMPGTSYAGPLPPLDDEGRALAAALRGHVVELAGSIGPRNLDHPEAYEAAASYIEGALRDCGYDVRRRSFDVLAKPCHNLEAELPGSGRGDEIVIIGAHYDSYSVSPGANDNGTGVAALLELSRKFAAAKPERAIRWVAFANEEPPYFQTDLMGSRVYARESRERGEDIVAMLALETVGAYYDEEGTQQYPFPFNLFYPSTANFIGFVGNRASADLVKQVVGSFREHARFPSEGAALYGWITGVSWSDHWSFWEEGYRALMVTDTAPFRYPHYHTLEDTPDKVSYDRLARVVVGLEKVISELANP